MKKSISVNVKGKTSLSVKSIKDSALVRLIDDYLSVIFEPYRAAGVSYPEYIFNLTPDTCLASRFVVFVQLFYYQENKVALNKEDVESLLRIFSFNLSKRLDALFGINNEIKNFYLQNGYFKYIPEYSGFIFLIPSSLTYDEGYDLISNSIKLFNETNDIQIGKRRPNIIFNWSQVIFTQANLWSFYAFTPYGLKVLAERNKVIQSLSEKVVNIKEKIDSATGD